ncbi:MAG: glycosyltransferase [Acidobacteriia bacterium]|nr:glycosyltransferase [Terriglobia bacterium]
MPPVLTHLPKLLVVHPSFPPAWLDGGPVKTVFELCRHLVQLGHEVTVLTSTHDSHGSKYAARGVRDMEGMRVVYERRLPPWRYCFAPGQPFQAVKWAIWADVVVLMSVFDFNSAYSGLIARLAGKPLVVSPRGNLSPVALRKTALLKKVHGALFDRPSINRALFVHCTSSLDSAWASRYAPRAVIRLIPNGVAPPSSSADSVRSLDRGPTLPTNIVFIGRFHPVKNIHVLVEAFSSTSLPNIRLTLAGSDDGSYSSEIRRLASTDPRIAVLPFTPDPWTILSQASFVVLPSLTENFGNVILEALSIGKPVVVTETSGVAELVRRTGAGLVAQPTASSLRCALHQMVSGFQNFSSIALASAPNIRERYSWPTLAQSFSNAILERLSKR